MTSEQHRISNGFYSNPVYPHSFPDPFVIKFNGEYFAYCTGDASDGNVFGVLRSRNLIEWDEAGGAMRRLNESHPFYWAPEVTYWNGTFYLYYSVGNEELMHIRLATSKQPDRGFEDVGVRLTSEEFAIDPHVFTGSDGTRYLFYATDFLEHTHIGTGIVVDRMKSWCELAGEPRPVVRAKYDWQVYDPNRLEKGGVRWHTVEGPFVLERKRRKYVMFSGGNWKQPSYGVGFAATNDIEDDGEWQQFCDGDAFAPVLRTEPGKLIGPGHNSVIRGPDNRQLYCVYHHWNKDARVLSVNRMGFIGDHIVVESEPYFPKRRPISAWTFPGDAAINDEVGQAEISSDRLPESFLCEFSFYSGFAEGEVGFELRSGSVLASLRFIFRGNSVSARWHCGDHTAYTGLVAPLEPNAIHLVRVEVNVRRIKVDVPDAGLLLEGELGGPPEYLVLLKTGGEAIFSGFALADGFEDLFDDASQDMLTGGWKISGCQADWRIESNNLYFHSEGESLLHKGEPGYNSESVINLRLVGSRANSCSFGFVLIDESGNHLSRLVFSAAVPEAFVIDGESSHSVPLPDGFDTGEFHQYSFHKYETEIEFAIDTRKVESWNADRGRVSVAIFVKQCEVAIDMVRVTNFALPQSDEL